MSTEAARDELRIARQYFQKYEDTKGDPQKEVSEDLYYALKYIEKARALDPTVTLTEKLPGNELGLLTLNHLEAQILFRQAKHHIQHDPQSGLVLAKGRDIAISKLERAISLEPRLSYLYTELAGWYRHRGDTRRALALLKEARAQFPANFDVRSMIDSMESPAPASATSYLADAQPFRFPPWLAVVFFTGFGVVFLITLFKEMSGQGIIILLLVVLSPVAIFAMFKNLFDTSQ